MPATRMRLNGRVPRLPMRWRWRLNKRRKRRRGREGEREKARLWEEENDDDDEEGVFIVATDTTYGYCCYYARRCHGSGASLGTGQEHDRDPLAGPAHDACR
jgi:hypothetical protein